jgi:hypothetical protein
MASAGWSVFIVGMNFSLCRLFNVETEKHGLLIVLE